MRMQRPRRLVLPVCSVAMSIVSFSTSWRTLAGICGVCMSLMLTNVCDNSVEVILCADSLVRARGFIRPWRQLSPRRQLRFQRRPARLCRCRVSLLNLGHVSLSGRHCYALLSQTLEWQGSGVVPQVQRPSPSLRRVGALQTWRVVACRHCISARSPITDTSFTPSQGTAPRQHRIQRLGAKGSNHSRMQARPRLRAGTR